MTTIIHGDNGITFPDSSVQPSALTTGAQNISGVKTFTDNATFSAGARVLVSGTAQNTTSGTAIDFTSIPSWVKRITVMLNGVSASGTSNILLRVGTSGGIVASGYAGVYAMQYLQSNNGAGSETTGFLLVAGGTAVQTIHGQVVLTNLSGNIWVGSGQIGRTDAPQVWNQVASISLGGVLDRLRLTTASGTDTFDAGSVNILYEG